MPSSTPIITLLTDFDTRDTYVGVMKGVILSLCPTAQIIDLTHEIPPGDIRAGALALRWAAPYFPPGAVHLAVVDPGVGGPRRPLVLQTSSQSPAAGQEGASRPAASSNQFFVGPDNGLLWPAAAREGEPEAWEIDLTRWERPLSATFHGRDLFAPAAARLAADQRPAEFCRPAVEVTRLEWPHPRAEDSTVHGEVISIDRFGNAITNLTPADLGAPAEGAIPFTVAGQSIRGPSPFYGAVPEEEPVIVLGSAGFYEIAINRGNAARSLGLQIGSRVEAKLGLPVLTQAEAG